MNPANSHSSVSYIHSLTPMRGLAAIWVMLFHIDVSLFYRDLGALLPRDATGLLSRGYLWVDFFFLLSGFVMAHVYSRQLLQAPRGHAVKHYLWARFARIYPLHLFTLLVLMACVPLVERFYPAVIDGSWTTYFAWSAVPSNLLLTQSMNQHVYLSWNMVSWSIGAEWWTYVIAIPCIILMASLRLWFSLAVATLSAVLLVCLVYWLPAHNLDITFNYGFFRCLFEFNIGLMLYQLFKRNMFHGLLSGDVLAVILLLAIVVVFHTGWQDLLVIPLFGLLILALAYNRGRVEQFLNKPVMQYLGDISYAIYMVHCLWFMVFWFAFPSLKSQLGVTSFSGVEKFGYSLVFVALTITSSHFIHRYIERPAQRKLLALFKPAATKAVAMES
jgi:peptidoglycan/LPS O-acetylase OafA/YrhL